jgi:hypothetical protein
MQQLFLYCHDSKPSPGNPVSANNQVPNDLPPHVPIVTVQFFCNKLKQESHVMGILTMTVIKLHRCFLQFSQHTRRGNKRRNATLRHICVTTVAVEEQ